MEAWLGVRQTCLCRLRTRRRAQGFLYAYLDRQGLVLLTFWKWFRRGLEATKLAWDAPATTEVSELLSTQELFHW